MSDKAQQGMGKEEKHEQNSVLQAVDAIAIPVRRGGRHSLIFDLQAVEDTVAEMGTKIEHLEAALLCSSDTITRRLKHDPGFVEAYERGIARYRMKHMQRIDLMADKNPIIALAIANQPHILGWTNGRTEISGKVDHVHSISPATLAFQQRREARQLRESVKQDQSIVPNKASISDAELVEVGSKTDDGK